MTILRHGLQVKINNMSNLSTHIPVDPDNSTWISYSDGLDFVHYVFNVMGIVITMMTLVGNTLVIIAVITEKKLRKVGNVFIINLALSDCLVGLIVTPLAIFYDLRGSWVLSRTMCDFWVSMDVVCCTASILNLCAISYDRSNAIIHPIRYSRYRTFSRAWTIAIVIWLYSVFLAVPPFLGWRSGADAMYASNTCHVNRDNGYTVFSTIGAFYLPTCIMTYFYLKIYRVTRSKKSRLLRCCDTNGSVERDLRDTQSQTSEPQLPWYTRISVCCSDDNIQRPVLITQTSVDTAENVASSPGCKDTLSEAEDKETRRESIEPELLAIYQIRRQRSRRNCSTVTESSFGSTFMSFSTDSSTNTATTSFSESSDRSSSISTECSGRSFSEAGGRRYSVLRSHRLSSARRSSLKTEVIHELVAAHAGQTHEEEEDEPTEASSQRLTGDLMLVEPTRIKTHVKRCDTDDGNDEESDEPQTRQRTKKLKSSTFRHRNSRKRRRIALSQEKRAAKTLGIVMGCFIVCWLPFFVVTLLRPFCTQCLIHPLIEKAVVWLGYFNSACNPFIYSFFNKDFRHAFKRMTCGRTPNVVHL